MFFSQTKTHDGSCKVSTRTFFTSQTYYFITKRNRFAMRSKRAQCTGAIVLLQYIYMHSTCIYYTYTCVIFLQEPDSSQQWPVMWRSREMIDSRFPKIIILFFIVKEEDWKMKIHRQENQRRALFTSKITIDTYTYLEEKYVIGQGAQKLQTFSTDYKGGYQFNLHICNIIRIGKIQTQLPENHV